MLRRLLAYDEYYLNSDTTLYWNNAHGDYCNFQVAFRECLNEIFDAHFETTKLAAIFR